MLEASRLKRATAQWVGVSATKSDGLSLPGPHSGRRDLTPISCPLETTDAWWDTQQANKKKGWFIHKVQNISVLTSEITQNFSE